jgi:hypothetical protein
MRQFSALIALALLCAPILAQPPGPLRTAMGLSAGQVQAIERGEVVGAHLPSTTRDEIGALGVVRINISPDAYLKAFSDIEAFEGGPAVGQIRRLSIPPAAGDFAGLSLPEDDVHELTRCDAGDCDVQLDRPTLERLATLRKGTAGAIRAATAKAMEEMLFDLARRYLAEGNAALPVYKDRKDPVSVAGNLRSLVEHDGPFPARIDELRTFLLDYPRAPLPGSQEALFWTINTFGLKATLRLNHAVAYVPRDSQQVASVVAIKQLYATHYFHAALELRFVLRDPSSASRLYLVCVNRSRSDGLTGFKGALLGSIIRRRALEGVRKYLRFTKERLERQ